MRIILAVLCLGVGGSLVPTAGAQRALATTQVSEGVPLALLTLRPEADLRPLAQETADVLELRTGQRVDVGDAPPPGLLEAVPYGHIALARRGQTVLLVIGASGGRSFDASVALGKADDASNARALALAAETLRDTATEFSRRDDNQGADGRTPTVLTPSAAARYARPTAKMRDGDEGSHVASRGALGDIDPLLYVRLYSGASSASSGPMLGLAGALGVCVERHCLFVASELPLDVGPTGAQDLRYRYLTFVSGFYSRPHSFGAFTPGASLGFFTRLGHFEQDMGLQDRGLETDLGARGSLELAWELTKGFDFMAEGGADFTIDRQVLVAADGMVRRGDHLIPWGQGALRYRAY